jgi:transposase InsO family protein
MQELSKEGFCIEVMSVCYQVSRSGYYSWLHRKPSKRKVQNMRLLEKIKEVHSDSKQIYGCPKVFQKLIDAGETVGKNRVERIMRENNIKSIVISKFRAPNTTDSNHDEAISPNLLNQNFHVFQPNRVWVSDITYIPYAKGFLYLCQIKDLCTKKIVGWSIDIHMRTELILQALHNAVQLQGPGAGLILHSDRGSQYASGDFREALKSYEIIQSMSRKGNCYDNAPAESFFSSLKREFTNHQTFKSLEQARSALFEYIEIFYNRKRLHSAIQYMTPIQYEEEFAA